MEFPAFAGLAAGLGTASIVAGECLRDGDLAGKRHAGTLMERSGILELIYAAIDEANALLPPDRQIEKSPETQLFGRGSKLDSLGLVNLVVATEARLAESGLAVALADERAMSQKQSPFRTVGTLCDYISTLVQESDVA